MDSGTLMTYAFFGIGGMALSAVLFAWICGIWNIKRLQEKQLFMLKQIAKAQGVSEDAIKKVEENAIETFNQ